MQVGWYTQWVMGRWSPACSTLSKARANGSQAGGAIAVPAVPVRDSLASSRLAMVGVSTVPYVNLARPGAISPGIYLQGAGHKRVCHRNRRGKAISGVTQRETVSGGVQGKLSDDLPDS